MYVVYVAFSFGILSIQQRNLGFQAMQFTI